VTNITTFRTEYPDSLELGRVSKGGVIKIYFSADNLEQAQKRIDVAIAAREYLISKLGVVPDAGSFQ
jgi:hypothetical protein